MIEIDTGLEVKVQSGYRLRFDLVPQLAEQGVVLMPCYVQEGRVKLTLLNAGRNIAVLKNDEPLAMPWLEREVKLEWS